MIQKEAILLYLVISVFLIPLGFLTIWLSDQNLMQPLYDCVTRYASIGEICGRLRAIHGSYHDPGFL